MLTSFQNYFAEGAVDAEEPVHFLAFVHFADLRRNMQHPDHL